MSRSFIRIYIHWNSTLTLVHDLAASFGSSLVFFSGFLSRQSSTASTSSPFTSFCIFHYQYQLQFREYGAMGEVLHIVSNFVFSYHLEHYISRFAEHKGPGPFSHWHGYNSTPAKFYRSRLHSQCSRYFIVKSTFESMGEVLHICFLLNAAGMCIFCCWT